MTGNEGNAPESPAEGSDQVPPPNAGSPRKQESEGDAPETKAKADGKR